MGNGVVQHANRRIAHIGGDFRARRKTRQDSQAIRELNTAISNVNTTDMN